MFGADICSAAHHLSARLALVMGKELDVVVRFSENGCRARVNCVTRPKLAPAPFRPQKRSGFTFLFACTNPCNNEQFSNVQGCDMQHIFQGLGSGNSWHHFCNNGIQYCHCVRNNGIQCMTRPPSLYQSKTITTEKVNA